MLLTTLGMLLKTVKLESSGFQTMLQKFFGEVKREIAAPK